MTVLPILVPVCVILALAIMLVFSERPSFSFLCIMGAFGWAILTYFVVAFSGWGDGSSGNAIVGNERLLFYSPSICLLFYVVASVRFIPTWLEYLILLITTTLLLFFVVLILLKDTGSIIFTWLFVLYGFAACWPLLKQQSTKVSSKKDSETDEKDD